MTVVGSPQVNVSSISKTHPHGGGGGGGGGGDGGGGGGGGMYGTLYPSGFLHGSAAMNRYKKTTTNTIKIPILVQVFFSISYNRKE